MCLRNFCGRYDEQEMSNPKEWIRVAQVLRPQGRKGEVLADLYTDSPDRFAAHPEVWLADAGFAEGSGGKAPGGEPRPAKVLAHWLPVGRNAGRIVFHFADIKSISDAEALAGKEVLIRASDRLPLEDGSVYVADLIGATVQDRGHAVGVIHEILFPATPDGARKLEEAAPLLSVTSPDGEEILIPFASAFLIGIDLPGRMVQMSLPEGLLDLNRPGSNSTGRPQS